MAAAIQFSQLEKIIQEKTLYNILVSEYLDKETLGICGQGFWLKPDTFEIEISVEREMTVPLCKSLATLIGQKYNQIVTANERQEAAGWAFMSRGGGLWSFKRFVNLQHDINVLNNESIKKMINS